jgi:hypothetical protein
MYDKKYYHNSTRNQPLRLIADLVSKLKIKFEPAFLALSSGMRVCWCLCGVCMCVVWWMWHVCMCICGVFVWYVCMCCVCWCLCGVCVRVWCGVCGMCVWCVLVFVWRVYVCGVFVWYVCICVVCAGVCMCVVWWMWHVYLWCVCVACVVCVVCGCVWYGECGMCVCVFVVCLCGMCVYVLCVWRKSTVIKALLQSIHIIQSPIPSTDSTALLLRTARSTNTNSTQLHTVPKNGGVRKEFRIGTEIHAEQKEDTISSLLLSRIWFASKVQDISFSRSRSSLIRSLSQKLYHKKYVCRPRHSSSG